MGTSNTWIGQPDGLDSTFGSLDCTLVATIGATGAPTITHGAGLFTLTRTAAGLYTIGFVQPCKALLKVNIDVRQPTATGGLDGAVVLDNSASNSTPGINIALYAKGGTTATEITSGNTLEVRIKVKLF